MVTPRSFFPEEALGGNRSPCQLLPSMDGLEPTYVGAGPADTSITTEDDILKSYVQGNGASEIDAKDM